MNSKRFVFGLFCIGSQLALAEAQSCPELVGSLTHGPSYAVAAAYPYAYAGGGTTLDVVDVSDPASPTVVGEVALPDLPQAIAVGGTHVYVALATYGLRVVDVSVPSTPVVVGSYDTPDNASDVVVVGTYAYVADGASGLRVLDVGNPSAPFEVGFYDHPNPASAMMGVAVTGGHAYLADSGAGYLRVVDVSNAAAPTLTGSCAGYGTAIAVAGSHVYTVATSLVVYDVSNPSAPSQIGSSTTADWTGYDVAVAGAYAVIAGSDGVRVFDVSAPATPVLVGTEATTSSQELALAGTLAYAVDEYRGLRMVDLSAPAAPLEIGAVTTTPPWGYGVAAIGNTVFLADSAYGLRVLDLSSPSAAVELGSWGPSDVTEVAVAEDHAYLPTPGALHVLNVSNPSSPTEVGVTSLAGTATELVVGGDHAFVGTCYGGLLVIDVSDPAAPFQVGSFYSNCTFGLALAGSRAYLADCDGIKSEGGSARWIAGMLRVVDVSDPTVPTVIGAWQDVYACPEDVAVLGSYAYLLFSDRLRVVDVGSPPELFEVASIAVGGDEIALSGTHAWIADGSAVHVVSVANPYLPVLVGSSDAAGTATDVAFGNGFAYVSELEAGLEVFRDCGPLFNDGFESGDVSAWAAAVP